MDQDLDTVRDLVREALRVLEETPGLARAILVDAAERLGSGGGLTRMSFSDRFPLEMRLKLTARNARRNGGKVLA